MDESSQTIYQQSEVLWAKIRGYPWWPAYVRDVHEAKQISDYQYTVIFFGDNTNSRLGPSKLRKFPDNYAQFYMKAKTNKKLKQSIQKAEQRLSENHQDISMYENFRSQLMMKKKKGGAASQSRLSSSDKEIVDVPDLVKHKTQNPVRIRQRKQMKKDEQIFEESENNRQQSNNSAKSNNDKPNKKNIFQGRRRKSDNIITNQITQLKNNKIQQNSQNQQQVSQNFRKIGVKGTKQILQSPKIERQRYNMRSNQKSKQKMQQELPLKKPSQSQQQQSEQIQAKPIQPRVRRGRKGRPPKSQQLRQQKPKVQKQFPQPVQSQSQQQPVQQSKRGRKRLVNNQIKPLPLPKIPTIQNPATQNGTLSQKQTQKIKTNLSNRKQLTKILLQMNINTGNIKQILDLGTSLALQDGKVTKNIHLLLCVFKATLLHKYFPDNNKYRKKYQKIIKQKKKAFIYHIDSQSNQQIQQNCSEDQNKNQMNDQKQQKMQQQRHNILSNKKQNQHINKPIKSAQIEQLKDQKLKQIRIKANQKLQKMIRKAGVEENAKEYSVKIQSTFQQSSDGKREVYKKVAYDRMRNFKDKLAQLSQLKATPNQIKTFILQIITLYESQTFNAQK